MVFLDLAQRIHLLILYMCTCVHAYSIHVSPCMWCEYLCVVVTENSTVVCSDSNSTCALLWNLEK